MLQFNATLYLSRNLIVHITKNVKPKHTHTSNQSHPYSSLPLKKSNGATSISLINLCSGIIHRRTKWGVRGGTGPPCLEKFRAIFDFSGNLSKCAYILAEKFVTAIASPKKKKKVITCLDTRLVAYLGQK